MPDGLNSHELSIILGRAIGSGRALGIDITIFNPKLDETGAIARSFVDALAKGLAADGT
jgi:arginase